MLFADTSYLVGVFVSNDGWHERAMEIARGISEEIAVTDHVFSEFITLVSKRSGNKAAYEAGRQILESDLAVLPTERADLVSALEYVRKHPGISMCDAVSAAVMQNLGIRRILSFDSDFDDLGFERIS